tara:strand:+ start:268 stop:738 length:471 start_codon:yes stop_codon:yes gene_type:complete
MENILNSVKSLLTIVKELQSNFEHRKFTLDGRLVGDIGEVIAEKLFDIKLFERQVSFYDAYYKEDKEENRIQIKATMKAALTYPRNHTPHNYIGLQINPLDESEPIKIIFNGPGHYIQTYLDNHRKQPKSGLYLISNSILSDINNQVKEDERIPLR